MSATALLSRRAFLKGTGAIAAALASSPLGFVIADPELLPRRESSVTQSVPDAPPAPFGRVTTYALDVRAAPRRSAPIVRRVPYDTVLRLREQAIGEAVMRHNAIWYRLEDGWVYSSWVQPVQEVFNRPEPLLAKQGFWGEVSVPLTVARTAPNPQAAAFKRLYYTSVYRVVDAVVGSDGEWWYRLRDGVVWSGGPYVPAAHIRHIPPEELTPLSSHLSPQQKRIEIDLRRQVLTAYEGDQPVLASRTSTGFGPFQTPKGRFRIIRKRFSSRMIGGEGRNSYDLPGVPFPSYFTTSAVAIHGAYWHNDFGRQRSHGCVNTPADVARWIWRWTLPSMDYNTIEIRDRSETATQVIVF